MSNWLAETIRFRRSQAGLSAAALSRQIGKSSSYIAKVESGKLEPSVTAFARIAVALRFTNAEIAWLIRVMLTEESEDG